jgi:hypothetical protein
MRRLGASLALMGVLVVRAAAQPSEPVYLQYDGYAKNANGTYTLWFGYFNLNRVDVTIQPGPENTFSPGPGDRNQPIVFRSGRHRFACTMVMPKEFDGKLQWTLKFAGTTSTTTAKGLDPLYELEEASVQRGSLGFAPADASVGVCTNRAPTFLLSANPDDLAVRLDGRQPAVFTARLGEELLLNARVEDDGLPRGGTITSSWKQKSGPGKATFSNVNALSTRVSFSASGAYELELSGSDGASASSVIVEVTVDSAK